MVPVMRKEIYMFEIYCTRTNGLVDYAITERSAKVKVTRLNKIAAYWLTYWTEEGCTDLEDIRIRYNIDPVAYRAIDNVLL
jgi:hypothetical protein